MPDPPKLFVSYAHADQRWIAELRTHLDPLKRFGRIDAWDDSQIRPGEKWNEAIQNALEEADIAVLLVTPHFLASNYTVENQLPELLKKQHIFWIAVTASLYQETPIGELQSANDPARPLDSFAPSDRHAEWVKICHKILEATGPKSHHTRNLRFFVPYEHNEFFTGREADLEKLHQAFQNESNQTWRQVLYGTGGIGKTSAAIEYCHLYRHAYEDVFWTNADSYQALENEFIALAHRLDLPVHNRQDDRQYLAAMQEWFAHKTSYLLVLDNAEDPYEVRRAFPRGATGRLLLTTRIQDFGPLGGVVPSELVVMEPEQAHTFLFHRTGRKTTNTDENQAVQDLAEALGYLPLALEQAAAFLQWESAVSFRKYLDDFRARKLKIFEQEGTEIEDLHATVLTTWNKNLERVKGYQGVAAPLVRSAFFAPDAIPEAAAKAFLKADPNLLPSLLTLLERYSLIRWNRENHTYSMHRLLQEVIKSKISVPTQSGYARDVVEVINKLFPKPDEKTWQECERLLPHALLCAEHISTNDLKFMEAGLLLFRLATYLYQRARYAIAEPYIETLLGQGTALAAKVMELVEQSLGENNNIIANRLNKQAVIYYHRGMFSYAEPLFIRALTIRMQILGPQHLDTATSLHNLALIYAAQGLYEKANLLYEEALKIEREILPSNHLEIAISLNNLSDLYKNQSLYEKAKPLMQEALEIRRKALSENHPLIAQSLNNLGELYLNQGNYERAEPLLLEALEMMRSFPPQDKTYFGGVINNLASLYYHQGLHQKAELLYEEARQALPDNHPALAICLYNLARLYTDDSRYEEAEPQYLHALEIFLTTFPENHPYIALVITNLAEVYERLNKQDKITQLRLRFPGLKKTE